MTVHIECACGSTLSIEDGSEDRVLALVKLWNDRHGGHQNVPELGVTG